MTGCDVCGIDHDVEFITRCRDPEGKIVEACQECRAEWWAEEHPI